jgi:glycosyltransferase involved in cell wall biosynthesis
LPLVAIVSKLYPRTHYTIYLGKALEQLQDSKFSLIFYRSRSEKDSAELSHAKNIWSQNILYPFQIIRQSIKDRPRIVHVQHEFSMFGGPMTAGVFPLLLILLRLSRARTIVTIHAIVPPSMANAEFATTFGVAGKSWLLLRCAIVLIYRSTALLSSAVIVHAKAHQLLLERAYSANPSKINVVPIGVPENYKPVEITKKWTAILHEKRTILFFGYLTGRKGVEFLLRAFADLVESHSNWVLVVAGGKLPYSDSYVRGLQEQIIDLGVQDKVVFLTTTPFPTDELHELFELADFVVLPYTLPVGGGSLVLSYAMQHAKPVIVTESDVMRELVGHGEVGFLCRPKDVVSLKEAMRTMMDDPSLRHEFSAAMRKKAAALAWSNSADMTKNIYLEEMSG